MAPRFSFLLLAAALACSTLQGEPQQPADSSIPEGLPPSAWLEKKEITQIRWTVSVWKPTLRSDLRQELSILANVSPKDLGKTGEAHDLVMFARVLDRETVIGPVHSVVPLEDPRPPELILKARRPFPISFQMSAIVRPGKYNLELALLDRTTGRYSTRFEKVFVEATKNDPLEEAFQEFSRFEFVPRVVPEESDRTASLPTISSNPLGGTFPLIFVRAPTPLSVRSSGRAAELPSFVVRKPVALHLSIIAILTPPENVIGEDRIAWQEVFQDDLVSILSVVTRLRVDEGEARFTGIDLMERKRAFDGQDVHDVTPELLRAAIRKDLRTISLSSMAGAAGNGRFIRDVLKEAFDQAEKDTSGEHAILVIGARTAFRDDSLEPLPASACRCSVHYIRFFQERGRDDVEKLLRNYKPRIYVPLSWEQFREQFGKIYVELQMQN
jgi:hypothetical protein